MRLTRRVSAVPPMFTCCDRRLIRWYICHVVIVVLVFDSTVGQTTSPAELFRQQLANVVNNGLGLQEYQVKRKTIWLIAVFFMDTTVSPLRGKRMSMGSHSVPAITTAVSGTRFIDPDRMTDRV